MNEVLSASVVLFEQDLNACLDRFNINTCLMGSELSNTDADGPTFVSMTDPQSKYIYYILYPKIYFKSNLVFLFQKTSQLIYSE